MKQIITYIFVLFAVCSCSWFDDSKIWEELREHEERIERLEALCGRLNSNVEALQGIMKALEANDYVTDITRIMEDGMEVGYSITFAKGGTITVYHGVDGADASAPKIGIRKASDGEYYWTADDEWMTDEDGEMIPASVAEDTESGYITPQFRVAGGKWYVSVDNGNSWREIEKVNDQEKVIFSRTKTIKYKNIENLSENKYGLFLSSLHADIVGDFPTLSSNYFEAVKQNNSDFLGKQLVLKSISGNKKDNLTFALKEYEKNKENIIPVMYLANDYFIKGNYKKAKRQRQSSSGSELGIEKDTRDNTALYSDEASRIRICYRL